MSDSAPTPQILPYSAIVGQSQAKLALELTYIAPRIGGVLLSGDRGTGKSTIVRAFSQMVYDRLPITLPINATEDRVVGGWNIDQLMLGKTEFQEGLLKEADGTLIYVDEVNLLDDHIVNIILDVASTGVLVVQRDGIRREEPVSFTLIGTMNPEEGGLRPQLLDRFGLMVNVKAETDAVARREILDTVLKFDEALFQREQGQSSKWLSQMRDKDGTRKEELIAAQERFPAVEIPEVIANYCVTLATALNTEGHRADFVLALGAKACAALEGDSVATTEHLRQVAPLALQHRRHGMADSDKSWWEAQALSAIDEILSQ